MAFNEETIYNNMSDEEILKNIKAGDDNALDFLINKYEKFVESKASKFYTKGSEKSDIIQEGRIALYQATQNYNEEKHVSFKTFANLCIERRLITVIKNANRYKNLIFNTAISINSPVSYDENVKVLDIIKSESSQDPYESVSNKEFYNKMYYEINNSLSEKEKQVLNYFNEGKSYVEIANLMNCNTKSVDTALTRVRRKANKIKEQYSKE